MLIAAQHPFPLRLGQTTDTCSVFRQIDTAWQRGMYNWYHLVLVLSRKGHTGITSTNRGWWHTKNPQKTKQKKPMFLCLAAWPASARLACIGVMPRLCREGGGGGGEQERRVREGGGVGGEMGGGGGWRCLSLGGPLGDGLKFPHGSCRDNTAV